MILNPKHKEYMQIALEEAKKAYMKNEVPVGAVIANDHQIIAQGHNQVENLKNPLMHAEIIVINEACKKLDTKFLEEYNIYITLEPCALCIKAISMVRLKKIFFATEDPKQQSIHTNNLLSKPLLSYQPEIYQGILEQEAKILLKNFFQSLRIA
jgi:pyrimidine deaminase RibD-like protein